MQLYDLLAVRSHVFVVEQQCVYHDLDSHDHHPQTQHILGYLDKQLVAYARILPAGLTYPQVSIGRVATISSERGKGYGNDLINIALKQIEQCWPCTTITIGAQYYLQEFYQRHGFNAISEQYLDDGIAHIDMQKIGS